MKARRIGRIFSLLGCVALLALVAAEAFAPEWSSPAVIALGGMVRRSAQDLGALPALLEARLQRSLPPRRR